MNEVGNAKKKRKLLTKYECLTYKYVNDKKFGIVVYILTKTKQKPKN